MGLFNPKNSFQENIKDNFMEILFSVGGIGVIYLLVSLAELDAAWSWNPLTLGFWSHLVQYAWYLMLTGAVIVCITGWISQYVLSPLRELFRKWNAPDDR